MRLYLNIIIITLLISHAATGFGQDITDSLKMELVQTSDIKKEIDLCNNIADQYLVTDIDSASKYTSQALKLAISTGYLEGEIAALTNKSYIERMLGNFDSALIHVESAQKKAESINDQFLLADAYLQTGILYQDRVIYNLAFENFTNALQIYEQLKDTVKMVNAMNWIGNILTLTFDLEQAIIIYSKALNMAKVSNDTKSMAMLTNNIANIYGRKGQANKAMEMYKKALEINIKRNHFQWSAINNQNIALEFVNLEELDSAEFYMHNALSLINKTDDNYISASILAKLGALYIIRNELVLAKEYLHKADSIASEFNVIEILVEIKKSYTSLYHRLKDYESEANYLREYKTLSDSLMSDRNTIKLADLKFKYNYEKKQKESELKNQRTKYISIIVIIFSVSGFIILILLYIQQKTRANKAKVEKEKFHLKNENLQHKLELKNKEITSNTMIQLQKNELLNSIIEKLQHIKFRFAIKNYEVVDEIIDELKKSMHEKTWESFLIHFEKVYESFFSNLSQISDNLTLNDKRLCAFLRLKMTTKEIATITNTNIRSIEMARHRLRKKLNITDSNINLDSFLENI